jgi:hypothetical protein
MKWEDLDADFEALHAIGGKEVVMTEYHPPVILKQRMDDPPDFTYSEQEHAEFDLNFHKLAFSKPYVNEIVRWYLVDACGGGFGDGGVMTREGRKKAGYFLLRDWLFHSPDSKALAALDPEGAMSFRGFFGEYEVSVPGYQTARVKLNRDGARAVTVVLERQSPYHGEVWNALGKIEGEDFDLGGPGVAFQDWDPDENKSKDPPYRKDAASANVEIGQEGDIRYLGPLSGREWFEYTVNLPAGVYDFVVNMRGDGHGNDVVLTVDGMELASIRDCNAAANDFGEVRVQNLVIPELRNKVIRLSCRPGGHQIDWFRFESPIMQVAGNGVEIEESAGSVSAEDGTDFGTSEIGSGSMRSFVIKNAGNRELAVGEAAVAEGTLGFTVTKQPKSSLAPGESTVVEVTFTPSEKGVVKNFLKIPSTDLARTPFFFAVQGEGL